MAKNDKKEVEQVIDADFKEVAPPASNVEAPQEMLFVPEFSPKPKKKNTKKIIFGVVGIALAGFIGYNVVTDALRGPDPIFTEMQTAEIGSVYQTINTTGTLVTGEKVTVFSPVSAQIIEVSGEVGTYIGAGTPIVSFNTVDLERNYRQASAARGLTSLQAQAALDNSKESQQVKDETQASINNLRDQRNAAQNLISQYQGERANRMAEFPDYTANKARLTTLQGIAAPTQEEQTEMFNLKMQIAVVEAALGEIDAKIAVQQGDLAATQGLLGQMDSANTVADKTVLDENGRQQLKYQGVSSQVSFEMAQSNLVAAQQGLEAPISGIITALNAEVGSAAAQYSPLFVIESLDKVDVTVSLSRFDLERVKEGQKVKVSTLGKDYDGVISKINAMATQVPGSSGSSALVMAKITLLTPDKEIRLGLEASVEISTAQVENVVKVPVSAVNTDIDGTYCFVVVDGIAKRTEVTIGISSESEVEILSGIQEGDVVVLSSLNIADGTHVTDDPAFAPTGAGVFGM